MQSILVLVAFIQFHLRRWDLGPRPLIFQSTLNALQRTRTRNCSIEKYLKKKQKNAQNKQNCWLFRLIEATGLFWIRKFVSQTRKRNAYRNDRLMIIREQAARCLLIGHKWRPTEELINIHSYYKMPLWEQISIDCWDGERVEQYSHLFSEHWAVLT